MYCCPCVVSGVCVMAKTGLLTVEKRGWGGFQVTTMSNLNEVAYELL